MALFPWSARFGIAGIIAAIVVLYTGINVQRSPFQALRRRRGAVALPFARHGIGHVPDVCRRDRVPDARPACSACGPAFLIAAGTVLVIAVGVRFGLGEPPPHGTPAAEATFHSLFERWRDAVRGAVPGMRAVFLAALLLQLTFQTFTTWFALHGTERFGVRPEDVTIGFIAWAIGGVIGALPAGCVGVRFGRRNAMLLGFPSWRVPFALDRVTTLTRRRHCWRWPRRRGRCRP